jgi:cell wall-associated NlpC family hydrolase
VAIGEEPPDEAWGEPCMTIRHFDCVTLVQLAFQSAGCEIHRRTIDQFGDNPRHGRSLTQNVGFDHIWTADVLTINDDHIALAVGDGRVVQAEDTHIGVTVKALNGNGGFTRCGRLPHGYWRR